MNTASICVVICGPTSEEIQKQIHEAEKHADYLEWRLDGFETLSLEKLAPLKRLCHKPVIFTLRTLRQGGRFSGTESARLHKIEELLVLDPAYIDLEADTDPSFLQKIKSEFPSIKILISHHDFSSTPEDLNTIYDEMQRLPGDLFKIAIKTDSPIEALRLLNFKQQSNLIRIGMGDAGQLTRIIGPLFKSNLSYAALSEQQRSAPGQLIAEDLKHTYHYNSLNSRTGLYGLIGGPNVSRSFSHLTHNAAMQALRLEAVYVKMSLHADELNDFLDIASATHFGGLSVTMPLKEAIIPFLDGVDIKAARIGAVNTVRFEQGRAVGYNTDCSGALNALEALGSVRNKRMILFGAGGASRAIAFEGILRGAQVIVLNRDVARAESLAKDLGCQGGGYEQLKQLYHEGYDILVNATSTDHPIDPQYILPEKIVMDINSRPILTRFLDEAQQRKCAIIPGYHMFVEQAVLQFKLWFGEDIDTDKVKEIIRSKSEEVLKVV